MKLPAKPFNVLGKSYGLKEFNNFIEVLEGDYVLLADIPEWVGLPEIRSNVQHVGPLPLKLDTDIPDNVTTLKKNRPLIYFAMGSSGKPGLIVNIIEGFKAKPYNVIAPVETHLKDNCRSRHAP
jgi:UDP:flavonoid glycosyltransferase YjiC (YdhE family)